MTASGRPATPADVDEICAALPHTWFGTTWGDVPTWLVPRTLKAARTGDREKGRGFLSYRKPGRTAIAIVPTMPRGSRTTTACTMSGWRGSPLIRSNMMTSSAGACPHRPARDGPRQFRP